MKSFLSISFGLFLFLGIESKSLNDNIVKKRVFADLYGKLNPTVRGDPGEPLILTDLIEAGKLDEAQDKARVQGLDTDIESYSGYLTVDKEHDSNLFFWFFPSQGNASFDPVVLWLQGGPGSTSMFGLFKENGPVLLKDGKLDIRETTWNKNNSLIYIDQPAGTGWSFTTDGYASNQTKVAADLYEALHQFFTLFYQYQHQDFYVTGESYAGKYVPAISYKIHQANTEAELKINLKGLAIGNGHTDPIEQIHYAEYAYQIGVIDLNARNILQGTQQRVVELIKSEDYAEAYDLWSDIIQTIQEFSALNIYNYLTIKDTVNDETEMNEFLSTEEVRKAIHVGNATFNPPDEVYANLEEDFPKSEALHVAELLKYYRVLIYSGQTDLMIPYVLTESYLQNLKFPGSDDYAKAERIVWHDENDPDVVAGYAKTAGNLTEILVRNAGHLVPTDQPEWALQLINKFTRNVTFI
ncbi:venom serine carboxypeptidase-like [Diabrotica virgifera virgifera]|uniref:Carboxypeptidase n=1 Tax=Diabrotica virgifera virgifera TaxID=50390 RepID=A0A6P7G3Z3_DIAVI|nr:venom serine carboxypeptidase-like [Diabrotica virgifera virgifera]